MTVETKRRSPLGPMLAWLWPEPQEARERRPGWLWLSSFSAWVWPSALQNEGFAPRAGMAWLMHGLWPASLDRWLAKWWGASWLWSWIWPGKLMGPDGEICALAPWHPATRAACDVVPWQHRIGRKGGMAAMMFAATAIAAPTFMEGNGPQDGGRLNLFRGGGGPGDQGADQGGGGATDPTGGPSTGGTGDGGGFNPANFTGGGDPNTPPSNNPPNFGDPPAGGGPGGGGPSGGGPTGGNPDTGAPDGGPTPGGGDGLTFLDSNPSGGGGGGGAGGSGAGGGGFFGGGGAGGDSGGGGGDGGTTPPTGTDPTNPTGPTNPTNPTDPNPGGSNPVGPPTPPIDKPTGPTIDFPVAPGGPEPFVPPTGDDGPKSELPSGGNQGVAPQAPIPEPATWAMLIVGFGAVGYAIRRRRVTSAYSKAA